MGGQLDRFYDKLRDLCLQKARGISEDSLDIARERDYSSSREEGNRLRSRDLVVKLLKRAPQTK